jgi:hypothetical protein
MGKLDPIISEFETEEDAAAYDIWFRAQVEAGLASTKPRIPHAQVMAEMQKIIESHGVARPDLGN